ncbi:DUF6340 family protein [Prevotella sp. 10(H)]|uniref:DUF6340 family protein n=1 Tax=Prevotella sp. 10(H) TaxID=1158294 RepID=UPI0004A70662|nr:DUF6340 family protein [Prevotella sp. 10(H)]
MKYLIYSIILACLFASCASTNYLTIDVRQPAFVSFPPEVVNVVIVDNTSDTEEENEDETNNTGQSILSLDSARTIFLQSLQKYMSEEKYFNNVSLYHEKTYEGTGEDVVPLSAMKIQSICEETDADALLSLDIFGIAAQVENEQLAYFTNMSILGAKLGAIVNIYSKDGTEYSKPLGVIDSLFREVQGNWSRKYKDVGEINDLLSEMSMVGADKLTSNFVPSWKPAQRWYYTDNSSEMKQAAQYAAESKWKEAAEIWGKLFEESKKNKQIRLASNIALANECLDDVENAVKWINIAHELLPSRSRSELALHIMAYRSDLIERLNNIPKLNEQLGTDESGGKEPE